MHNQQVQPATVVPEGNAKSAFSSTSSSPESRHVCLLSVCTNSVEELATMRGLLCKCCFKYF
jgi:hypothetical protein